MKDLNFTAFDGDRLTGKIPVQVRVWGTGDEAASRAACQRAFAAFLDEVRTGGLMQQRRAFAAPGLCSAIFTHRFGTTTVDLYLVPQGGEEEPFYGGIVVKLVERGPRFTEQMTYGYPVSRFDSELPDFPSNDQAFNFYRDGAVKALAGLDPTTTPLVPMVSGTEVWVVVQVKKGESLSIDPVKRGAIKLRGIKRTPSVPSEGGVAFQSPRRKKLVEISREQKYLLQAEITEQLSPGSLDRLDAWSLAGQPLDWIPPLYLPWSTRPRRAMITHDMTVKSISKARGTQGLIVVVDVTGMFVFSPGATAWVQIAPAAGAGSWNYFGSDLTTSLVNGTKRIACTGTNAAGSCSEFTVVLTPTATGYSVTGEVVLRTWGATTPAVPPANSLVFSGSYTDANNYNLTVTSVTGVAGVAGHSDPFYPRSIPEVPTTVTSYTANGARTIGTWTFSASGTVSGAFSASPSFSGSWVGPALGSWTATGIPGRTLPLDKWYYTAMDAHGHSQALACRYDGSVVATATTSFGDAIFASGSGLVNDPTGAYTGVTTYGQRTVKSAIIKGGAVTLKDLTSEYDLNRYVMPTTGAGTQAPGVPTPAFNASTGQWVMTWPMGFSHDFADAAYLAPGPIFDCVLADMRSGAYVRQRLWYRFVPGVAFSYPADTPSQDLAVGNDVEEVPLIDVINEWLSLRNTQGVTLGQISSSAVTTLFIHPDTPEVSLL